MSQRIVASPQRRLGAFARFSIVVAFVAAAFNAIAQSQEKSVVESAVVCPRTEGFIDGPYVSDEAAARIVATAIINQKESPERRAQFDLRVQNGGAYWNVFQYVRDYPRIDRDRVVVATGSGGLGMRIAKCDGAISDLHWQR